MTSASHTIRPMLAAKVAVPALAGMFLAHQPKIDGVRALIVNGQFQSRSGKPFANRDLPRFAAKDNFVEGMDGELVVGDPTHPDVCRRTCSVLNSHQGDLSDLRYILFDLWNRPDLPFLSRSYEIERMDHGHLIRKCPTLPATYNHPQAIAYWAECGWIEGTIFRKPSSAYKHGRSTLREAKLLAVKPFTDAEGEVISMTQRMTNTNPLTRDELGFAKRSSAKAGKIPTGTMGTLVCKSPLFEKDFEIGTGFDESLREELWINREDYIGKIVKFKYLAPGSFERPRCPVFLSFRMEEDISHD